MKEKLILLILLAASPAWAGDIQPGVTWSDDTSDPNSLVNSNRLTTFLTDATLKTNAITDRTETTVTATNDLVLIHDVSIPGLRKVALLSLLPTNGVAAFQLSTGAVTSASLGTNSVRSYHLLTNWADAVTANTNLVVNMPAVGAGTNIFFLTFRSTSASTNHTPTNSVMAITPLSAVVASASFNTAVQTLITNAVNTNLFVTAEYAVATGRTATNHGLGALPAWTRWVMVCKTNDAGYGEGEEVDVTAFEDAAGTATPQFSVGASSTNIYLVANSSSISTINGTNGTANTAITEVRWRLKGYARP